MTDLLPIPPKPATATAFATREAQARDAARQLEVTFLAEMLKSAGFGEQANSFSGNPGEDHFASFHREAVARNMVDRGGIGLSEHFFRSMMESYDDA